MVVDNATFFHGYNHFYHFHKANLIYYNYKHLSHYMKTILPEQYPEVLQYVYLGDQEEYYKRTLSLDLRSTYFHSIETLYSLVTVLNKFAKPLLVNPNSRNILDELTIYDQRTLYQQIETYGNSKSSLDFLDMSISDTDWTIGRSIFYAALRPPENIYPEYMNAVNGSVNAIKFALHLLAKDFGDRKEYNSYKHSLRVLDAFESLYLLAPKSGQMIKMLLGDSLTYPVWDKKKKIMNLQTKQHDIERDHKMTLLAAALIRSIVTNRLVAHNVRKQGPDKIPQQMWTEEVVAWHASPTTKAKVEPLTLEEFERKNGFKVNLRPAVAKSNENSNP